MKIIGINSFLHDSSATLISDGKVIAAAEEERFNRLKHTNGFPVQAIKYCLKEGNIAIDDIDHIAFFMKPFSKIWHLGIKNYLKHPIKALPSLRGEFYNSARMLSLNIYVKDYLNFDVKRKKNFIIKVDHHLAHISSAFLASGYDESAVLSIDGCGENSTCVMAYATKDNINVIKKIYFPHSIGLVYASITAFLGFAPLSDEYKVMGLASYGKPEFYNLIKRLIRFDEKGSFKIDADYFGYQYEFGGDWVSKKFHAVFGKPRKETESIEDKHKDIAASLQLVVEELGISLATFLFSKTKSKNLCIAGGVGLNCAMNGAILRKGLYKNLFVQPAAHDSGTSLGSALYVHHYLFREPADFKMKHNFLGPGYSNDEIKKILIDNKIRYEHHEEIEKITARHLANGKIVGWFQERMEFGPRALGSRSILADPRSPVMKDIVNERIKHREPFRPFAPSIMKEYATDYFIGCKESPFMTFVFPVSKNKGNLIPSVTHIDGTARVQTVDKENNLRFWKLINEFQKLTDVPVLLNTSFNVKGEPIVCSPEDAIRCFYTTGLDFLVLGNYLITK